MVAWGGRRGGERHWSGSGQAAVAEQGLEPPRASQVLLSRGPRPWEKSQQPMVPEAGSGPIHGARAVFFPRPPPWGTLHLAAGSVSHVVWPQLCSPGDT